MIAQKSGFSNVELLLHPKNGNASLDGWDFKYIQGLSERYNIKINSIHLPFSFWENPSITDFKEVNILAERLGAKYIIAHTPRSDQKEYINVILPLAKQKQDYPLVLIENIPLKSTKPNPIFDYKKLKRLDNICFDVAHAKRSMDVKSFNDLMNDVPNWHNIRQFHISEWDGKEDHLSLSPKTNFLKQLREFFTIGNSADLCLELCPKAFKVFNEETIIKVLKNNKEILESIYLNRK